jgi:hypothetical protein
MFVYAIAREIHLATAQVCGLGSRGWVGWRLSWVKCLLGRLEAIKRERERERERERKHIERILDVSVWLRFDRADLCSCPYPYPSMPGYIARHAMRYWLVVLYLSVIDASEVLGSRRRWRFSKDGKLY